MVASNKNSKKKHENQVFFLPAVTLMLKRKKYNSESALWYQLLKLISECGISFFAGAFKNGKKCAGCWTIIFYTLYDKPLNINFQKNMHFGPKLMNGKLLNLLI